MTADIDTDGPVPAGEGALGETKTILLVEEEAVARALVGAELRRHGYRVLEAATAEEACDICAVPATVIDLLITDLALSVMTGPGLAQRMVGQRPELRVLFVAGGVEIDAPQSTAHPNVSFLRKPLLAAALLAKVHAVLTQRRTTR